MNRDSFLQKAIEEEISNGDLVTLCVTGKSMRPYLSGTGSEFIVVSKHRPDELKSGVIIFFTHNGRHVFHRVIGRKNEILIAQGDGNYKGKETVSPENIHGIVRFIIRENGRKVSPYSFAASAYWHIWYILRPIRRYLLYLYNKLKK